ncbi:MAG TPA: iron ABC transporter permease [Candidatus Corynebacterium avicola]|uniref:Iron ABC transporter permease n=1 Tax=Candidatus Corynebacterium avicola TaxID=2838527 RepID=A0A9D1UKX7_9CORY|nr:iron ABC transporter permease [Candidatus Corynebacterium avicola]
MLLVLLVIVAAPLAMVLITAVTGYRDAPSALGSLVDGDLPRVLGNTVWLSVLVVIFSTVIAAPLAFLTSWTQLRKHWWIDILVMIPFMTPPFVAAMAWMDITRLGGVGDMLFGDTVGEAIRGGVNSVWGMALVMSCEIFPFLYLLLRNCFDSVPASTIEMGSVTGASRGTILRRIILPQVIGPWSLGALIVFVRAAGEFGTPVTLGNAIGFEVLVSRIHQDVTVDPLDFSSASVGASLLFTMGIGVWCLQQWITRSGRAGHQGGRIGRPVSLTLRPAALVPAWVWVGLVALVTVIVPYVSIILGATTILRSEPPTPDNLTLDYFSVVLSSSSAREALSTSAILGAVGATAAVVLALLVVLVTTLRRHRSQLKRPVDLLAIAPETVPAIVLAIGFIFLWNSSWLPATPYNTPWILVLAYSALFLPMAVQNIKTSAQAVSPTVFDAAAVTGASSWLSFRRITVPLLIPGIIAGWLLAFLTGIRELVMASLIRPSDMKLLSPWIMGQFDQGHRAEAMTMTLIGVISSTVVLLVVQLWLRRRGGTGVTA